MAVLTITKYPDEVLRRKAAPVGKVDDDLRRLIDDMVETMYAAPGIGLAAPQVGVSRRLVVVDVGASGEEGGKGRLVVLVNPEVLGAEGECEVEEGCLSIPEFTTFVRRAERIIVAGLDRRGKRTRIEAEGLLAVALQHEMDHLDGIIILDKAGPIKREFYKKRVKKSLAGTG